ncbi:NHL-repeat-containing protein 4 [Hemicordylus capensis]|uniref:NHL-repeat-containing protein 4 n=1 Tax=Hemicordylus capensis TaxID=884348 RepID=UPI002304419B|nr:NHL-repeat-containing protein 4 [Hemicordylus capensis]XP_053131732.1 NHL-repeat-containing protein 4 [Hemicordylus capensis]
MEYTLEDSQRKEKLLKTVYTLQVKSDATFQKASPLLSNHPGMGLVTEHQVHQLAEKAKVICHDLDNIKNHLFYRQNDLVQQIPNPNGDHYGCVCGIHCSLDGVIYVTSENAPRVHILNRSGQALQTLPCVEWKKKKETFMPEDVTITRAGMVAVTDMVNGTVRIFNNHSKFSKGEWLRIGRFGSPRGIGVDTSGKILVADYEEGKVHSFAIDHAFKVQNTRSVSDLCGPRYVCSAPEGGFLVSEECGDVKLFNSSHKLVSSICSRYGHRFGNPAGVCTDREGNIIVADEQHRKIHLFPRSGSPICLVSKGLQRPTGIACSTQGLLLVADTGDNNVKVFKYRVRPHYDADILRTSGENPNLTPRRDGKLGFSTIPH